MWYQFRQLTNARASKLLRTSIAIPGLIGTLGEHTGIVGDNVSTWWLSIAVRKVFSLDKYQGLTPVRTTVTYASGTASQSTRKTERKPDVVSLLTTSPAAELEA